MAFEAVDACFGTPHISSDDLAALNEATIGARDCVLKWGDDFKAVMTDANTCLVGTGVGMVGGKRFWNQAAVSLTVQGGTQGQKRSMDRASGSGVFARDPDALLDMTALEMTDECMRAHYDLRRRQAVWAAFDRHMPGWRADERFIGADSADQLQAWANEPANGAPYALQAELSEIYDGLEVAKRGWAAWRIEGTLREFASFKPKNLWFEYPVHTPDETGALADLHCEGEFEPVKRFRRSGESAKRGRETKAKNDRSKQEVKIDLMRDAIDCCIDDGVEPTRENVLERIGEFDGEQVTKSQLMAWTRDKAKWSPFRVKDDGSNALYDTTDVAFEFDGEIDLSGVLD